MRARGRRVLGGQIAPEDRWKIIAYIRALQLSQRAPLAALPEEERKRLDEMQGKP